MPKKKNASAGANKVNSTRTTQRRRSREERVVLSRTPSRSISVEFRVVSLSVEIFRLQSKYWYFGFFLSKFLRRGDPDISYIGVTFFLTVDLELIGKNQIRFPNRTNTWYKFRQ